MTRQVNSFCKPAPVYCIQPYPYPCFPPYYPCPPYFPPKGCHPYPVEARK